jgi:phosphate transport system substrate-binding protein
LAALPVLLALLAACGSPGTAGSGIRAARPADPGELTEAGSTLLLPLLSAWSRNYHSAVVTTSGGGSGQGIASASAGKVDIGASDAFLSSGDMVKNPRLLNIPLVVSAQQVNYSVPGLPAGTHLRLSGTVLAQMYQGKITSWDDPRVKALNPGVPLPATRVVPLHRSDSSGDTFLFTSYLSTNDAGWNSAIGYGTTVAWPGAPGARAEKGNSGMVSACARVAGCVAYIGVAAGAAWGVSRRLAEYR